jgi:5-methyltetrahydropteroyltriglutamate--homocysteine methyltransferase
MRRVTTKRPHLEPIDELVSRIREASRIVPMERLAISPQCGSSNSVMGKAIAPADQQRKLRLVEETVRRVWGEDTALVSS